MYLSFYQLAERPFQINAEPGFLWLGETHKEALAVLKYGVMSRNGILALTGDVGTGKTTLINALLEDLDDDIIVANIVNSKIDLLGFLNLIGQAFHIPERFDRLERFIFHFKQFLQRQYNNNCHVLLIVDEAHKLSLEILEQIRLLSNIEMEGHNLISIFLVGQNELNKKLLSRESRALRQRITIHYQLKPLLHSETLQYCNHRLKLAGSPSEIFNRQAIYKIHRFSRGYPRLINIICERALIAGYANGVSKITPEIIRECARELLLPGERKIKLEPELARMLASAYNSVSDLSLHAKTRTFYYQFKKQAKQLRVYFVDRFITGPLLWLSKHYADKFSSTCTTINIPVVKRNFSDSIQNFKNVFFKRLGLRQAIHHFFSKVFNSGLANTALALGSFSLALLFSLWYQGILPSDSHLKRSDSLAMRPSTPATGAAKYRVDLYGIDHDEANVLAVPSSVEQAKVEPGASGMIEIPALGLLTQNIDQMAENKKIEPSVSQEERHPAHELTTNTGQDEIDNAKAIQAAKPPVIRTADSRPPAQKFIESGQQDTGKSMSLGGFADRPRDIYSLQVGAFLYEKNATKQVDMLEEKGYPANLVKFIDARGRNWYTVRLGTFNSLSVAEKQAEDFSTREKMDSIVRPVGRF